MKESAESSEKGDLEGFPSELRSEKYCPARPQEGIAQPYYQDPAWGGILEKAELPYVPSGRFEWKSLPTLLLLPSLTVPIAFYLASLPLRWFGWSTFLFDFFLLGIAVLAGSMSARGCRSRWVGAVSGLAAGALMWSVLRWFGVFDSADQITLFHVPVSMGDERWWLAAIVWAVLPLVGWWAPGELPFCEACLKPYSEKWEVVAHAGVHPTRILYSLRKGRLPKTTKGLDTLTGNFAADRPDFRTKLVGSACPNCGEGILSAVLKYKESGQGKELRFYCERWTRAEISRGGRDDSAHS